MAKKATGSVKLQIAAGKATPAPSVGPALGQAQINIMEFCKQFNARTNQKELEGLIIPVVVTVYSDRSFTFITKTPPLRFCSSELRVSQRGRARPTRTRWKSYRQASGRDRKTENAGFECCPRSRPRSRAFAELRDPWVLRLSGSWKICRKRGWSGLQSKSPRLTIRSGERWKTREKA